MEPLSVAVYACERGKVRLSSSVLIFGAGPVGLMSLAVARTLGAGDVTLVDIDPRRLEIAKHMGATSVESAADKTEVSELCLVAVQRQNSTFMPISFPPQDSVSAALARRGEAGKWDVVLECSGVDQSLRLGLEHVSSGGCVVLVGRGTPEPELRVTAAAMREVDLVGVFRYANCFPKVRKVTFSKLGANQCSYPPSIIKSYIDDKIKILRKTSESHSERSLLELQE